MCVFVRTGVSGMIGGKCALCVLYACLLWAVVWNCLASRTAGTLIGQQFTKRVNSTDDNLVEGLLQIGLDAEDDTFVQVPLLCEELEGE